MRLLKSSELRLEKPEKLFLLVQSLLIGLFFFGIGFVGLFAVSAPIYPYKIVFAVFILVAFGTVSYTYRIVNYGSAVKRK